MNPAKSRPKHLNLLVIKLPLPGVVSVLHRVSGVLLILAFPFSIWLLDCALESAEYFAATGDFFTHPFVKLIILGFGWALFHHLCAGIRFLLTEAGIGVQLAAARRSSVLVLVISLIMAALLGAGLFL